MTPRSALVVLERGERVTPAFTVCRHLASLRRIVTTLLLGGVVGAVASRATAQTTTLSGTTTGNVSIAASTGTPLINGDSVLTGTATFIYTGEASLGAIGTMTSNLSGTGALWFSSPATLVIEGTNTYSGGTSVTDGGLIEVTTGGSISHATSDLRVGVDGGPGSFTLSGGSVGIGNATIGSGVGVNSELTVNSGTFSGSGGLTVAAGGASGVFELNGGTVGVASATIGSGKGVSAEPPYNFSSNGSVIVNAGTWTTTNGLVLGTAEGTGSLTLAGGAVNSGSGTIGDDFGSTGSANVTGGTWTNSGDLTVGGAGTGTLTIGGAGTVIVGGLLFRGTGGTINLSSGGTLQIGNGGNSGALGNDLTNDGTLVFNRSGTSDQSHVIDGSGAVVKQGTGTLVLSAANGWAGSTSIDGGVLELGNTAALGSTSSISFGGGTLRFTSSNTNDYSDRFNGSGGQSFKLDTNDETVTLGSVIAGSGSTLEKLGGGTLILAEDNTYTGTTTVTGGTLQIGAGGSTGSIAGGLVNNAAVVFNRSNDLDYGGVISGSGALEQLGSGTLTLSGANAYAGGTTLSAGTLSLGNADAIGSSGTISFAGGTLQFTSANTTDYSGRFSTAANQAYKLDTNGENVTLATSLTSVGGSLEKLGAGTLTLSGANTFAGGTTLTGGTLSLGSAGSLGDATDPAAGTISFAGGTLQYSGSNNADYSARFSSVDGQAFSIDTNGRTVTFASDLTSSGASLAKLGSGTLALTGSNDVSGGLSLHGGTLRLGDTSAIGSADPTAGTIEFLGGTLQFTSANTVDVSARISTADGQAFNIDTDGADVTFATPLQGTGNTLTKVGSGTLTLSADNGYDGDTTISAGTLRLGSGGASGSVAGNIVNNGSLVFDSSDIPTYSGAISGNGSLTQDGTGTLVLTGSNSYTGGTNLDGGVLALGSLDAIGSTGTISFGGGTLQYNGENRVDYSSRISTAGGQAIRIDTSDQNVDFLTGLAGAGSTLEKLGGGTLTLSATSTYSGGTTVSGDTLKVASTGLITHASADLVVGTSAGNGTLLVNGGSVSVRNATLGRDDGSIGLLTVDNGGTFTSSGTLLVGSGDSASGTFTVAGGTVTTAAATIGAGNGTGSATVSGGSWTNSGDLAVGNGTLTISSGTVTVGGTLSESSPTSIALLGGELRIGTGGAGGVLQANLNLHGSLVFNSSSDSSYGRVIEGSGTLTKTGSGTLTLTNAGTYGYSGLTTVSAGGLVIDGSLVNSSVVVDAGGVVGGSGTVPNTLQVNSGGTLAPGLAGGPSLFTVGALSLQDGSLSSFGIVGNGALAGTAGTNYDSVGINDPSISTFAGTLRLNFSNPVAIANGEVFQLFAFDGAVSVGNFSSVIAAGTGVYRNVSFYQSGPKEWTSTYGTSEQYLRFSELTGRLEVVPEPSTWGMLLAGGAAAGISSLRRRRQKMLGM
jgi:fibronectin-binding autotransporter adhesin